MSFELQQIWYHIEDFKSPSEVKMIRQVMDIYTSDDSIDINFGGTGIFGLQFIGRNLDGELAFIHKGNSLKVNVSNLNWPYKMQSNSDESKSLKKHIKLEIKYFVTIKFRRIKSKWQKFIFPFKNWGSIFAYIGSIETKWLIRPEFTIKLPLGLKMLKNVELNLSFYRIYPKGFYKSNCKRVYPYIIQYDESDPFVEDYELDLKKPDVTRIDGKRVYTFVIDDKDYNDIILKTPKGCSILFHGDYNVVHENRFVWIPIFGILLIPFLIIVVIQSIVGGNGNLSQATVIVAVLSYFILFLTLKREGYEIPLEKPVNIIIGVILAVLTIWILLIVGMDVNTLKPAILSWVNQSWSF